MAKAKQEFVQHITPRDENFSQWYTDVVTQADLMDYTPVRGTMAMKPLGTQDIASLKLMTPRATR